MISFQVASDLHIEYKNNKVPDPLSLITPSADILILCGDIGSFYKYEQLKTFLSLLCGYFKIVLYIPGNCEYYRVHGYKSNSIDNLIRHSYDLEKCINNLYILNRSSINIGNVCVVGCTLWSDLRINIPHFVRIYGMDTHTYKKMYFEDLNYIKKMIRYCEAKQMKLLVVTHHVPTYLVIKKPVDRYASLYASDLDDLLDKKFVHTWLCGHIHSNFDFITKGGTHLVGNQFGKPHDYITDYDKEKVITI